MYVEALAKGKLNLSDADREGRGFPTRLGRSVTLKFLPEAFAHDRHALEHFQREARAASAIDHPHICTIHDIAEYDGQPFLVMELMEW